MIVLKEFLEEIGNEQIVDICCGVDENNTLTTPKTVFYGKAIDAYAKRKELEDYWKRKIIEVTSYIDDVRTYGGIKDTEKKNISVIMIKLKSYLSEG